MRRHLKRQAEERLAAGNLYQDSGLVFQGALGPPLHESVVIKRHFKPALEKAGLPKTLRLYDLRHTAVTLLLTGPSPNVVAERLGRESAASTLRVYSDRVPNMQRQTADRMERLLGGQAAGRASAQHPWPTAIRGPNSRGGTGSPTATALGRSLITPRHLYPIARGCPRTCSEASLDIRPILARSAPPNKMS